MIGTVYYQDMDKNLYGFVFDSENRTYREFQIDRGDWYDKTAPKENFRLPGIDFSCNTPVACRQKLDQFTRIGFEKYNLMTLDFGIFQLKPQRDIINDQIFLVTVAEIEGNDVMPDEHFLISAPDIQSCEKIVSRKIAEFYYHYEFEIKDDPVTKAVNIAESAGLMAPPEWDGVIAEISDSECLDISDIADKLSSQPYEDVLEEYMEEYGYDNE